MNLFKAGAALLSGLLSMTIIFGMSQVVYMVLDKIKIGRVIKDYSMQIVSLVFFVIMYFTVDINVKVCNLNSLIEIKYYLYIIAIVFIVANVIARNNANKIMNSKEKAHHVLGGITMEIPQRLLMQTFLYVITDSIFLSIIINTIVWCSGIFIQSVLVKEKKDMKFFRDELSSIIFSIGIGYVYAMSECIILSMVAHAFERYLSQYIREKKNEIV